MAKLEDVLDVGLAALLPVYEDGNVTKLITSVGEQIIDVRTARTVLKNLARNFGVDLAATREKYGRLLNKRNIIPIPLAADLVLIPVKVREHPLGQNDGTLGYFNFCEIQRVEKSSGNSSTIILKCGVSIPTVVSETTVREYIKNARLVESFYMAKHFPKDKSFSNSYFLNEAIASGEFQSRLDTNGYNNDRKHLDENPRELYTLRKYLIELLIKVLQLQ